MQHGLVATCETTSEASRCPKDRWTLSGEIFSARRRLQTDHLDLWQIHGVIYDNDPELAYAKGGVIEALEQAKKQGKTRFVGFTGHKDPAFLKMLELGFPFDTVQMPLNAFDAAYHSFEKQVLPEVNRGGMAALTAA